MNSNSDILNGNKGKTVIWKQKESKAEILIQRKESPKDISITNVNS